MTKNSAGRVLDENGKPILSCKSTGSLVGAVPGFVLLQIGSIQIPLQVKKAKKLRTKNASK